jgi:hypothetical protein
MPQSSLEWLIYLFALVAFVVAKLIERRRSARRDARAPATAMGSNAPLEAVVDPNAWGRTPAAVAERLDALRPFIAPEPAVPEPPLTPLPRARKRTSRWRARLQDKRTLRDAFVLMTVLGPCAADETQRRRSRRGS